MRLLDVARPIEEIEPILLHSPRPRAVTRPSDIIESGRVNKGEGPSGGAASVCFPPVADISGVSAFGSGARQDLEGEQAAGGHLDAACYCARSDGRSPCSPALLRD